MVLFCYLLCGIPPYLMFVDTFEICLCFIIMNNKNKTGPITVPCGTPEMTAQGSHDIPSTRTRWVLFHKNDLSQFTVSVLMP